MFLWNSNKLWNKKTEQKTISNSLEHIARKWRANFEGENFILQPKLTLVRLLELKRTICKTHQTLNDCAVKARSSARTGVVFEKNNIFQCQDLMHGSRCYLYGNPTIMVIIFWDFLMFYQIFVSLQVKWSVIISN